MKFELEGVANMEKFEKEIQEDDVLAALLKVKPTVDMPRPGPQRSKPKVVKDSRKPKKV